MDWATMGLGCVIVAVVCAAVARSFARSGPARLPALDLATVAFRAAKYSKRGPSGGRTIDAIVMHTSENTRTPTTAEAIAAYFANPRDVHGNPVIASAHYSVDSNSIVQSVADGDIAHAAPPLNDRGLHIELAGRAAQTPAEWSDDYSRAELELAARLVATKARAYGVPLVWLDVEALRSGARGITGHVQVSKTWGQSTHTDPGRNFPVERFMDLVRSVDV